ncbi:YggU family protein [Candidatus Parcubacteria bacterium]|nr:MAG: YggU family protein [Candidatus Parcubacteria bacterium]
MARQFRFHDGRKGSALAIRVTPRASRNEIVEILHDGTVRIRLTAPPVEGKANQALIKFLAKVLDVSPSRIEIVAGHSGRDKLVSIQDMTPEEAHRRILEHLNG